MVQEINYYTPPLHDAWRVATADWKRTCDTEDYILQSDSTTYWLNLLKTKWRTCTWPQFGSTIFTDNYILLKCGHFCNVESTTTICIQQAPTNSNIINIRYSIRLSTYYPATTELCMWNICNSVQNLLPGFGFHKAIQQLCYSKFKLIIFCIYRYICLLPFSPKTFGPLCLSAEDQIYAPSLAQITTQKCCIDPNTSRALLLPYGIVRGFQGTKKTIALN